MVGMDSLDSLMVSALWTQTKIGLNDELQNRHFGKSYWVSTVRYPGAGWQTAAFDRKRIFWLMRPIFRVNEMDSPFRAFLNHCTAIIVLAEAAPESWPKGMQWNEPSEASWLEARTKILNEAPKDDDPQEVVDFYSALRSRYYCAHR
jgi:hypothetical protein